MYPLFDILRFADDNDGGDGDGSGGDGKGGGGGEQDLDRLRSEMDKKIADLTKTVETKDAELEKLKSGGKRANIKAEIERDIQFLDANDPTKALEQLIGLHRGLADDFASASEQSNLAARLYKASEAKGLALQIANQNGGDWQLYRNRLLEAKTDTEMQSLAKLIEGEADLAKKGRDAARNGGGRGADRIDIGSGSGASSNVSDEMSQIDVTTPEGQKQWEEKRAALRRKVTAAAR